MVLLIFELRQHSQHKMDGVRQIRRPQFNLARNVHHAEQQILVAEKLNHAQLLLAVAIILFLP